MARRHLATFLRSLTLATPAAAAPVKKGFDRAGALVPASAILPSGPPCDGIPAIDWPSFLPSRAADDLKADDRVLGTRLNGQAKAYPIGILSWHEIVNDRSGDTPVAVTYCPLCGTGMAFVACGGETLAFGVSGLLYNSDRLLYDRLSEPLWSQTDRRAISGPHRGERLEAVPLENMTWGDWRQRYPDTLVLSRDIGHARDYDRDPYAGYEQEKGLQCFGCTTGQGSSCGGALAAEDKGNTGSAEAAPGENKTPTERAA